MDHHHQCQMGHQILNQKCKHCKSIQNLWYKHLKNNGFEDVEKGNDLIDHKTITDLIYLKDFQTRDTFEAKVNYFTWASQMLHLGNFKSIKDQIIWEYHSDGLSRRKISERIGLGDRWCSRKIVQIREYLMISSSQSAYY